MRMPTLIFMFFLISANAAAESIKVGLFNNQQISSIIFQSASGEYALVCDGKTIRQVAANETFQASLVEGSIRVSLSAQHLGTFSKVFLIRKSHAGSFRIKANNKDQKCEDNLLIYPKSKKLLLINELDLEAYVAGVVEAETGMNRELEFYKVQSVISRTYALSNKRKHEREGFHVCDQVHCQVYHGKPRWEPLILEAVEATDGHVLVDHDISLITAAFHSNCGGQTLNAEKVWSNHLPYLIGKTDTFCLKQSQSHWEKIVAKNQWEDYLGNIKHVNLSDSTNLDTALAYYPTEKEEHFGNAEWSIPVTEIRNEMGLRSGWFTIHDEGENVRFIGRGFGHSVGLCQEGAIHMAELGYSYQDIIHFYYTDVHLIHLSQLSFFKDE